MKTVIKNYRALKAKCPEAILLFRVHDNYNIFKDDAAVASKILALDLRKPDNESSTSPLFSFPYFSLDSYLPKLVKAGYKVAVCDPLENAK